MLKIEKKYKEKNQDVANNLIKIEQKLIKGNSSLKAIALLKLFYIYKLYKYTVQIKLLIIYITKNI